MDYSSKERYEQIIERLPIDLVQNVKSGLYTRVHVARYFDITEHYARKIVDYIKKENPTGVFINNEEQEAQKQGADSVETEAKKLAKPPEEWVYEDRYVYNPDDDVYIIISKVFARNIVHKGNFIRGLFDAYSDWDGQPATINEICRSFEISRPYFNELRTVFGLTHDKEPFTDEEILNRDEKDLVADAVQKRRFAIHQQFEKEKWRETKKDAESYQKIMQRIYETLTPYNPPSIKVKSVHTPAEKVANDVTLVFTDMHNGADTRGIDDAPREYHSGIVTELLQQMASDIKHYYKYDRVSVMFLGDAIESATGLNHKNTWKNLEKGMYGSRVIFDTRDKFAMLASDLGVSRMSFVTGNHGRQSAANDLDQRGEFEQIIYRMVDEMLEDVEVKYHTRAISMPMRTINLIGLHGDKKLIKQDAGYIIRKYGDPNVYNLIIYGHIHKLEVKQDTEFYRVETCSALVPGADYALDNFAVAPIGYKVIQDLGRGLPNTSNCVL